MPFLRSAVRAERFRNRRPHFSMPRLWNVRPSSDSVDFFQATNPREKEGEKTMARRKLTLQEQLKGVQAALRSKRTPPQLREGLRRRADWLRKRVGKSRRSERWPW